MTVRVAKIEAAAAARPLPLALGGDTRRPQVLDPLVVGFVRDREPDVVRPLAVVGRDHAAGHDRGLERAATLEQEQHLAAGYLEILEAHTVAEHWRQSQHIAIERDRARQVVHIQDGFNNALDRRRLGHAGSLPAPSLARKASNLRPARVRSPRASGWRPRAAHGTRAGRGAAPRWRTSARPPTPTRH